jgi:hypothetical protein
LVPSDGGIEFMGPAGAPLALPAAPDGPERGGQHLPSAAATLEQIAELAVHAAAKFWADVVCIEYGQNRDLQFSEIDVGEVGQRLGSRHEGAS